jgi:dolichol-phosphate mannosyltransferase
VAPPADLSLVIPTFNERDRLAELVASLFGAAAATRLVLELIIVDDNSPDGTGSLADQLAAGRRIQVIHRPAKLGLGSAVVTGFSRASADIVGVIDADFSHPPLFVPTLVSAFESTGADLVVASRYVPGGSTPNWTWRRRWLSRVACWLARPLSPIRDPVSGFFLIRRSIAAGVPIQARGFKICLELIERAWPRVLVELPYRFDNRELGESKMNWKEAFGYLIQLTDLARHRLRARGRPARTYRRFAASDLARLNVRRPSRGPGPAPPPAV